MDIKQTQITSEEQRIMLKALAESTASPGCKFLEVGSWCGNSAIILGKVAQANGGHLFCVDWWKGNTGVDLEKIAKENDIFSFFWKNIKREGLEDVVIPIKGRSDIVAEILKEQSFDLIFLDGDHSFKVILNDIHNYAPLVKQNGVFCGHDCDGYISDFDMDFLKKGKNKDTYKNIHCGVVLAVGSVFKNYSIDFNIWSMQLSNEQIWEKTDMPFPIPKLIEKYLGFNLIKYRNNIFAIHQSLGKVDLVWDEKHVLEEYQKSGQYIIGDSLKEVKLLTKKSKYASPVLIEANYKKFNFVLYRRKYYALATSIGPVDLAQIKDEKLKKYKKEERIFIDTSLKKVKAHVDQYQHEVLNKNEADKNGE